ncbi:hypothetical protein [Streptomyces sp. NPDC002851]
MTETLTPAVRPRAKAAGKARGGRRMSPRLRKFVLTCHVVVSVGWLGLEIGQLIIGTVGVAADNPELIRATRIVAEILGVEVVAVAAWSSLITGLLLSLATKWGLLKHYWIMTKLVINVGLMVAGHSLFRHWLHHQADIGVAADPVSTKLLIGMGIGFTLLLTATTLSVYKPWGKTRFARRG